MDEILLDLPPLPGQTPDPTPGHRLSYSSLSTYEKCGLAFKFRYVDRLPSRPSPILGFGNALHEALRRWYNQPVPVAPPLGVLLEHLDDVWDSSSFPNPAAERTYKNHGREVLTQFHKDNAPGFRIPVALEQRFQIDVEGITVSGVIDRMDRHPDGSYEIIDYKSNRRLPPLAKIEQDLQLSIYALAAYEVWGIRPSKLTLYFLLPGQALSSVRTPDDAARTRERILSVANQIQSGAFPMKESPLCNWCDYQALCPLFAHQFAREADPEPDIQKVVDEWVGRKRRMHGDWRRVEELGQIIHDYCDRNSISRLFSDDASITRFETPATAYDPALVRAGLPDELLERVLRIDDAAVSELLSADDVPDYVRARLEEARVDANSMALRLKDTKKKR